MFSNNFQAAKTRFVTCDQPGAKNLSPSAETCRLRKNTIVFHVAPVAFAKTRVFCAGASGDKAEARHELWERVLELFRKTKIRWVLSRPLNEIDAFCRTASHTTATKRVTFGAVNRVFQRVPTHQKSSCSGTGNCLFCWNRPGYRGVFATSERQNARIMSPEIESPVATTECSRRPHIDLRCQLADARMQNSKKPPARDSARVFPRRIQAVLLPRPAIGESPMTRGAIVTSQFAYVNSDGRPEMEKLRQRLVRLRRARPLCRARRRRGPRLAGRRMLCHGRRQHASLAGDHRRRFPAGCAASVRRGGWRRTSHQRL